MKKILIILGHPHEESFCSGLADAYAKGAVSAGHEVHRINLGELEFDPVLHKGYHEMQELEPCLLDAQDKMRRADHIVFIYPNWWALMPAVMKGFIDRIFMPGFAFQYDGKSSMPKKLLKGKTARLLVTMDTPPWYYRFYLKSPGHNVMKRSLLGFCGIKTSGVTVYTVMKDSDEARRKKWLDKTEMMGRHAC